MKQTAKEFLKSYAPELQNGAINSLAELLEAFERRPHASGENTCIRTYTGRHVDVFNITPDMIHIDDIAHALSNQCRFGGHTKTFFSVAEHCIWTARRVPFDLRLAALMHDAAEAYLIDLPTPIKREFPQYEEIEHKVLAAIAQKFGFEFPLSLQVRVADREQLEWEFKNIVENMGIKPLTPREARVAFLMHFKSYNLHNDNRGK